MAPGLEGGMAVMGPATERSKVEPRRAAWLCRWAFPPALAPQGCLCSWNQGRACHGQGQTWPAALGRRNADACPGRAPPLHAHRATPQPTSWLLLQQALDQVLETLWGRRRGGRARCRTGVHVQEKACTLAAGSRIPQTAPTPAHLAKVPGHGVVHGADGPEHVGPGVSVERRRTRHHFVDQHPQRPAARGVLHHRHGCHGPGRGRSRAAVAEPSSSLPPSSPGPTGRWDPTSPAHPAQPTHQAALPQRNACSPRRSHQSTGRPWPDCMRSSGARYSGVPHSV